MDDSLLGFVSIQSKETSKTNKKNDDAKLSYQSRTFTIQGISKALYTKIVRPVLIRCHFVQNRQKKNDKKI